jgi:drug/metabolite transporter (DMT)-like permease
MTITSSQTLTLRATFLLMGLTLLWALGQVGVKAVGADIAPLTHAAIRSAGASLVLLAWAWYQKINLFERDGSLGNGLLVGLLFGFEFVALFPGIVLAGAARGTLLIYTSPFFVALGAHWLLPNEKLKPIKIAGLLAAFFGVGLVLADRLMSTQSTASFPFKMVLGLKISAGLIGDMLCIVAAMMWAATTLVVKATPIRRAAPIKILLYQIAVSVPILAGAALLMGETGIQHHTIKLYSVLAYGIFVIASASFLTWFWLMPKMSPTTMHTFTLLTPIWAVMLAGLLLDEPITPKLMGAVACVCLGIYCVNK